MSRHGKILLPILVALIVISLSIAGILFYLYQKEHASNIQLQDQIAELTTRQRSTEGKLDETKKTASELTLKLQEANSKVTSLTEELTQQKSVLTDTTNELDQVKSDLAQQKTQRQDLENRLKSTQDEGKQIKEQIKLIQQQKSELEEKLKNLEATSNGVELGKVIVNNEGVVVDPKVKPKTVNKASEAEVKPQKVVKNPVVASGLEGKIIIVNKEFNFAVIDLGSKDNVSVGDEFAVSRAGKYIGDLKVEKVHESMSAAGFIPELKDLIKENDIVAQKAK